MFVNFNVINQLGSPAIYEDILEKRPPASYPGRLFFATDAKGIFRDTGTSWTLLASIGSGSPLNWDEVLNLGGNFTTDRNYDFDTYNLTFNNVGFFQFTGDNNNLISFFGGDGTINLGDVENIPANLENGISLIIDQKFHRIYTNGLFVDNTAIKRGLYLDFTNNLYQIGDFQNSNNGCALVVLDDEFNIYSDVNASSTGIDMYYLNTFPQEQYNFRFGEINSSLSNGSYCYEELNTSIVQPTSGPDVVTDIATYYKYVYNGTNEIDYEIFVLDQAGVQSTSVVQYYFNGNQKGFQLDFGNKAYSIGDFFGIDNGTYIEVNDYGNSIGLYTNNITISGSVLSGSAGGNSGQHLQISINGTPYKIALLNA